MNSHSDDSEESFKYGDDYDEENEDEVQANDRNPSPPQELQQNLEAVFGDSIGQTAFSKHWVLTTLMRLMDEVKLDVKTVEDDEDQVKDVDEDFQNELCQLWDMSMNNEVAKYLEEFKAVDILSDVISKSKAPRVTEICVGILGNMACDADICASMMLNEKLVDMMLMLLKGSDTPTLVETTRLLHTCFSNKQTSKSWNEAIKGDPEVQIDVQFILQSSTNSDLLKSTTEFVGILLDSDDELCLNWADEAIVISLLEAIKQVGYNHSDALEPYLHIFQLFSTSETGVEALMKCNYDLLEFLLKYLYGVCEDEIVGLDEHGNCLASAISTISVLFPSSSFTAKNMAELMRCLLKILDPLYPLISRKISDNTQNDVNGKKETNPVTEPQNLNENNLDSIKNLENNNLTVLQENQILYSVLQRFLCDIVLSFYSESTKVTDEVESNEHSEITAEPYYLNALHYLESSCCRERIYKMFHTLNNSENNDDDLISIFDHISKSHSLQRLQRIMSDFKDGKA
ncbi:hypothetical protein SNE40_013323 [Patella caerulea]|uniref:Protein SAAL1 n=1 Tax=Patella caerulea TaxID=87958 RepID=A0AAN8JI27_PATCE